MPRISIHTPRHPGTRERSKEFIIHNEKKRNQCFFSSTLSFCDSFVFSKYLLNKLPSIKYIHMNMY